jgi:hypothetical protein
MFDITGESHKTFPFLLEVAIMCCDPNIAQFRATSVAVAAGVATITVPTTAEFNAGDIVDIQLFTSIPDGTDGAQLVITNGTTSASVMNGNGNYLRFYPLTSRTVLRVQFLQDPLHFQIINVFGKRIKRYA